MDVHTSQIFTLTILCIGCAAASVIDWRIRKIPNAIPIAWALCAIFLHAPQGPLAVLIVLALGFAILIAGTALFAIGWMGGGDVKLLAAGAMLFGQTNAAVFLMSSMIAGGMLAVITLLIKKQLGTVLTSLFMQLQLFKSNPRTAITPTSNIRLPYALAISAGAIFTSSVAYFPALIRIS